MRLHVADHPLVAHKLTVLRDQRTTSPTFRLLVDELVTLLAYEATRDVRTESREVTTPVAVTMGTHLAEPRPLVVPILRAGLGMLDAVLELIPSARVGLVIAALFAFILSFGDFVSPIYLGGGDPTTLSILITDTTKSGQQWPRAAVIALTMIGTLMVVAFAAVQFAYKGKTK